MESILIDSKKSPWKYSNVRQAGRQGGRVAGREAGGK